MEFDAATMEASAPSVCAGADADVLRILVDKPDDQWRRELAFYDAVSSNESAVELQGDAILAEISRELVHIMQRDVKTDWTVRDDVRAKLRSSIKRLLVKYKYPPDKQPGAIKLVLEQMEALAGSYAA